MTKDFRTQDFSKPRPTAASATAPDGQQVQIDFSLATDIKCSVCGNYTFHSVVLMKHLSELVSPTGKAVNVPVPTFACDHCGFVNDGFIPAGFYSGKNPTAKPDAPVSGPSLVL